MTPHDFTNVQFFSRWPNIGPNKSMSSPCPSGARISFHMWPFACTQTDEEPKNEPKAPLLARPGWFVQLPIIGGWNKPPRLRPLRRLRVFFLMGAATPPCPRRGLGLSLRLFSMPPCPARDVGHGKLIIGGKGEVPSLAKEGWPRHQVNGPVPLEARPGWFVQLPIIGGLNQPPRLRP